MVRVNTKGIAQRKIGIEFVLHDVMVQHFATISRWGMLCTTAVSMHEVNMIAYTIMKHLICGPND